MFSWCGSRQGQPIDMLGETRVGCIGHSCQDRGKKEKLRTAKGLRGFMEKAGGHFSQNMEQLGKFSRDSGPLKTLIEPPWTLFGM